MKIIIMAAGRGTRLKPLTDNKPKCMVEVNNKPIIKHLYDNIRELGDYPITIISGYKEEVLLKYSVENLKGCNFINQSTLDGTANAIFLCKEFVDKDFIVLSGDIIYSKEEIEKLMKIKNSLLYTRLRDKLYEYGTLDISGPYLKHINEKSTEPTGNLVNCGAYHFTQDVFEYIAETEPDERFGEKIITNTINLMIDDGIKFKGIPIDNLNEISYPEDIEKVEKRLNEKT